MSTNSVQIEQKSYEMPPREGISIAQFLTVTDIERSARYYEKVFGARILTLGDGNAPAYLLLANIWMILNVGGGPTADKPTVTLSVPDPNHINSFMNFRVAEFKLATNYGKVAEPNSSRSRYRSTARFAATSAILTATSSKSGRAPTSLTVKARPGEAGGTWGQTGITLVSILMKCPTIPDGERTTSERPARPQIILSFFWTLATQKLSAARKITRTLTTRWTSARHECPDCFQ